MVDNIINGVAWALSQLAHLVGDWGLAIIIVTLIIRLLLFPLQRKQLKSSFDMQQLQPRLQEIQTIYAGDQQKIQEETMKIYQETGFNPLAGCLPLIIQMPIFLVLFQALRYKIGDFATPELPVSFYNILPDLTIGVQEAWNIGTSYAISYVIFLILFIGLSIGPMVLTMMQQKNSSNRNQTTMMLVVFGFMFVWMGFISPAGVLLYWALSSGFGFVQQLVTNRNLKAQKAKTDAERPVQPVKVNVERREKKKRPTKSGK